MVCRMREIRVIKPLPLARERCLPQCLSEPHVPLHCAGVKASYQMCRALPGRTQKPVPFPVPCLWD